MNLNMHRNGAFGPRKLKRVVSPWTLTGQDQEHPKVLSWNCESLCARFPGIGIPWIGFTVT